MDGKTLWKTGGTILLGIGICLATDLVFSLKYRNYLMDLRWQRYAVACAQAFLMVGGGASIRRTLNRRLPWGGSPKFRFWVQMLFYAVWVLVVIGLGRNALARSLYEPPPVFVNAADEAILAAVALVVVLLVVAAELSVILLNRWRVSLAELERFKKENIEFHLEMLKTQVNPHFLFNSLNTLSSLIYTSQDTAAEFVRQLANVYRYVLENRTKEIVPLSEELAFLKSYVYLMELRFGHNLRIENELSGHQMPGTSPLFFIAPLTLQMLIENAVKHNVVSRKKPLTVRIYQTDRHYVTVQNSLQLKPIKEFSSQIGLENIRSRYRFITEKEVEANADARFFTVRIPLLEAGDEKSPVNESPMAEPSAYNRQATGKHHRK